MPVGILPHLLISDLLHSQSILFSLKPLRISEKDAAGTEGVKEERDLYKSRVLLSAHSVVLQTWVHRRTFIHK